MKVMTEVRDLVATNIGYARIVMILSGVQTAASVELAPEIHIVPFGDLQPPSWIKDFAEKRLWPLSRTFESVAPSAALVTRVSFSPVFTDKEKVEGSFPEKEVNQLRTIANCIALAAQRPAAILKVWYEDDDARFPLISSGVGFNDPRWGSGAAAPYDIDPGRVQNIVVSYQKFSGDRKPLDTAMLRLAEAWGGWHREERAIDLGISLEAVLTYTPDGQSDDNNEISYKLGVRASWLMGANPADRLAVFKKIRRLYRLRSQAAHTGNVKTKPETWRALDEEIEAGIALACQIVVAVLARGAWPNWDELVLGGTPA